MYAVSISTSPGWGHIGAREHREEIIRKFKTRKEAGKWATERADFGAPFDQQFCVLVSRKTKLGWLVVNQHHCDVW